MDKIKIFSPSYSSISNETLVRRNYKLIDSHKKYDYFNGSLKSLKIYTNIESSLIYSPKGITISVNPTKWQFTSNERQITFRELQDFVPDFINHLQINNVDFHLTGLDFNQDIITDYNPSAYLPIFENYPRYNKTVYNGGTGIQYSTKNKTRDIVIYDKIAEMKEKGQKIPVDMANQNRLRIEFCVNKNFTNSKLKEIRTLNDLINPNNYNMVVNEWYRNINAIHKMPSTEKNNNKIEKPQNMKIEDFAILTLVKQIGLSGYNSMVDIDEKMGLYSRNNAYKRKQKAKAILHEYNQATSHEGLLHEFNEKLNERYQISLQ